MPLVSSMIRSRTRSSSGPGTALDSRARASGSSRPSSHSCGRPSSARVTVGSRSEKIIAIGSATKRRATNPSVCIEAASSHAASSTRQRRGRFSAVAESRFSTATATRNRSGASPDETPRATRSASCCGSASASILSNMGAHSRWIPANGSSISAWIPSTSAMRRPEACRAAYRSSAVFPMPGSPQMTRTAL